MKISQDMAIAGILGGFTIGGVAISYGVNKAVRKVIELCLKGYNSGKAEEAKLTPRTITIVSHGAGYISFAATILAGLAVGFSCLESLYPSKNRY